MPDHASATFETTYDRRRLRQFLAGEARAEGVERRTLLKLLAAVGGAAALGIAPAATAAAAGPGIVKPLPPELFTVRGTNAESRPASWQGTGLHTPLDRFFVRNHTSTPVLEADSWRLKAWGGGLRHDKETEFGLDDLRRLPTVTTDALVECAGNGRSYFTSQQGEPVSGTAWGLGAIGSGRWRGVRLADVLHRAGISRHAVDVQPRGLDAEYVTADGTNLGRVRRPLPVVKAMSDVLLAYELNGEALPPDHGHPVRVLVPSWVGIASIKWVGDIEVSDTPLYSPWNTDFYRLYEASYPPAGSDPLSRQTLKSTFELDHGAAFTVGRSHTLTGRSWSGSAGIAAVEVSTDGGATWRRARLHDPARRNTWTRWSLRWRPERAGQTHLLARATDTRGTTQPDRTVHNTQGYLFDAVVRHPAEVRDAG
ncbi:sulfite oxidase [Streptomyces sp. TRM66268-LWL]|uniref:Sulfite oxidase n=1 Tax=Streptomyces polyasparticus TaxID=2767826 RepID=A0ABR7SJM6_9ACTN|nr:sulfite oxidase [Streptomyces polyasparticus]MBC9715202.1 sulfite oxidase [Streptomyces polyasparticus]